LRSLPADRAYADVGDQAKVVLCQRDVEAWYKSFDVGIISEIWCPLGDFIINWVDPLLGRAMTRMTRDMVLGYWKATTADEVRQNARAVYIEHYDRIRRMVPRENLLEYKLGMGWKPLCEFLGKEEPAIDFPWVNEAEALKKRIWAFEKRTMWAGARKVVKIVLPLLVGAFALYWYRR